MTLLIEPQEILKRLNGYPIDKKDIYYNDLHVGDTVKIFYNIFDEKTKYRQYVFGKIKYNVKYEIHYIQLIESIKLNITKYDENSFIIFKEDIDKITDEDIINGVIDSRKYIQIYNNIEKDNNDYNICKDLLEHNIEMFNEEIMRLYKNNKILLKDYEIKHLDLNDDDLQVEFRFHNDKHIISLLNFEALFHTIDKNIKSSHTIPCYGTFYVNSYIDRNSKVTKNYDYNIYWSFEIIDNKKSKLIISDKKDIIWGFCYV